MAMILLRRTPRFGPELSTSRLSQLSGLAEFQHTFVFLSSQASSPGTVFMFTGADSVLIAVCLEGFFYGKIFPLCFNLYLGKEIIPWSRTLLRNIRNIFTISTEQVQDDKRRFLCCLSTLYSIYCYRCQ